MGTNVNLKEKSGDAVSKGKTAWIPIILCWLAYTSAYLGRYSYNANITSIMDAFCVNHADAGLVTTFFFFAYGVGQIANGLLCKYYNKRLVVAVSLTVSSVLNIVVFLGVPFSYIKYLWLVNGAVQSILWSVLVSVMSENLKSEDLAKAIIVMSTSVAAGTFLTYGASSLFTFFGGYTLSFLLGAIIMTVVALLWFSLYKKVFRGEGTLAQIKKVDGNSVSNGQKSADKTLVFMIAMLGVFAIANNLLKDGITMWVPAILKENFGLPDSLSIVLTLFLPILGCFAAMLDTAARKRIKSFIALSCVWYVFSAICILIVIVFINTSNWLAVLLSFGVISLLMHAINNIITNMAPLYMRNRVNSGLLAGVLNGCCYIGSTISSYGLGHIADVFAWSGVFILLLVVCCIPILISFVIYILSRIKKIDIL